MNLKLFIKKRGYKEIKLNYITLSIQNLEFNRRESMHKLVTGITEFSISCTHKLNLSDVFNLFTNKIVTIIWILKVNNDLSHRHANK